MATENQWIWKIGWKLFDLNHFKFVKKGMNTPLKLNILNEKRKNVHVMNLECALKWHVCYHQSTYYASAARLHQIREWIYAKSVIQPCEILKHLQHNAVTFYKQCSKINHHISKAFWNKQIGLNAKHFNSVRIE